MLEERNKAASEAVAKIYDRKNLCTKAAEVISTIWEALLEYEMGEKIKADAQQVDKKISTAKVEMKKISLKEKVTKMAEIKKNLVGISRSS